MKVIMTQTVPKVGKEGTVVTVADGFARNYLFPRGYATIAARNQLKALEGRQARISAKLAETKASAEALFEKLDGKTIRIEGKVGDAGKLFGAITSLNILDMIKSELKVELDKKQIAMVEPIKRLGDHKVHLDLHREVDAFITVTVFDPTAPVETEEATEEAKAEGAEEAPAEAPAATEEPVEA
ncbi:MAG: 50S ribosomal protein L9 [Fimbriimonadaceae bacterium]|nr:50S ribosomal protein L9 [Fimbriimonadaceae bacterium]